MLAVLLMWSSLTLVVPAVVTDMKHLSSHQLMVLDAACGEVVSGTVAPTLRCSHSVNSSALSDKVWSWSGWNPIGGVATGTVWRSSPTLVASPLGLGPWTKLGKIPLRGESPFDYVYPVVGKWLEPWSCPNPPQHAPVGRGSA